VVKWKPSSGGANPASGTKGKIMNLEPFLALFLEHASGREFCDTCLAKQMEETEKTEVKRQHISSAAWTLAESIEFHRSLGKCTGCKEIKLVTRSC
jgi:hypothetical protein